MAVRFAENMVGLPRALVVSDARKAAPGDKVTVKGAVIGDDPVFSKNIASFTIGDPAQLLVNMKEKGVWAAGTVPVEIRKNNTMTVQFVDEQGQPIKHSAKRCERAERTKTPSSLPEPLIPTPLQNIGAEH